MKRVKSIFYALKFGLLPYWMYENERHYSEPYITHLKINAIYILDLLLFRETTEDWQFEKEVNNNY